MELVPPVSFCDHEAGRLELIEVLGDRLSRRAEPVLHHQPRAELEQCLTVSLAELIEDRPPCGVCECSVNISQRATPYASHDLPVKSRLPIFARKSAER